MSSSEIMKRMEEDREKVRVSSRVYFYWEIFPHTADLLFLSPLSSFFSFVSCSKSGYEKKLPVGLRMRRKMPSLRSGGRPAGISQTRTRLFPPL